MARICNYQNKECGCQIYSENVDDPDKCFYCEHHNAFHSGFTPAEPLIFGACQKDFARCGCQAFVASLNNNSKCKHCDHYNAFHQQKTMMSTSSNNTIIQSNNVLNLLSQIPTASSISNSSSAVANRQFLTPREEILASF